MNNSNNAKKKNDKAPAKSVPSNSTSNLKSNVESTDDNVAARVDVNDNTTKKKQAPAAKTDEVSSSATDNNVDNKNTNEGVSETDGAANAEPEVIVKEKPAKANKATPSETSDNAKTKTTNPSETNDKSRETKKSIPKGESEENIAKSGGNKVAKGTGDEKGTAKETKSKQNPEEKSNRSEEKVVKHEEIKAEEKAPPSPFKNKKTEVTVADNQPVAAGDSVPAEQNAVKEPVVTKAEKAAAKKSNNNTGANSGVPSGKMSPVAGSKGQKPSNNVKSTKKQSNDMKTLQKLSTCNSSIWYC